MLKFSCAALCAFVIGLSASASAQTTLSLSLVTPSKVNLLLNSSATIGHGDVTLLFFTLPLSTTAGNFVLNNGGTFSAPTSSNSETINFTFGPMGASNYAGGNTLAQLTFSDFGQTMVTYNPQQAHLYDTSNVPIVISGTPSVLVLHMEAVPEPGAYAFALALCSGLTIRGVQRRRRNKSARAS